jgi:hypothetical protein
MDAKTVAVKIWAVLSSYPTSRYAKEWGSAQDAAPFVRLLRGMWISVGSSAP